MVKLKKGQISFEYFLILILVLFIITPLSLVAYDFYDDYRYNVEVKQAEQTARILVSEAEAVFFLGPDSLSTKELYIPDNVHEIILGSNFLEIRIKTKKGIEDVVVYSNIPLEGEIPETVGTHFIKIIGHESYVELVKS